MLRLKTFTTFPGCWRIWWETLQSIPSQWKQYKLKQKHIRNPLTFICRSYLKQLTLTTSLNLLKFMARPYTVKGQQWNKPWNLLQNHTLVLVHPLGHLTVYCCCDNRRDVIYKGVSTAQVKATFTLHNIDFALNLLMGSNLSILQ